MDAEAIIYKHHRIVLMQSLMQWLLIILTVELLQLFYHSAWLLKIAVLYYMRCEITIYTKYI